MAAKKRRITNADVEKFEMLNKHLGSLYRDVQELAKKRQDSHISKLRVDMINRLLKEICSLLEGEPSLPFLDLLDEATLPQNADVMMVLGQYESAMGQFESKYIESDDENEEDEAYGL